MQSVNRVFTPPEWEIFVPGLGTVRDSIEDDIRQDTHDAHTGIAVFDRCSPEHKLALLADVATALQDPDASYPKRTGGQRRSRRGGPQGLLVRSCHVMRSADSPRF